MAASGEESVELILERGEERRQSGVTGNTAAPSWLPSSSDASSPPSFSVVETPPFLL